MLSSLYRQSESGRPPLRIGLLIDSAKLPSCFAEVVDNILQSDFACLELLVLNAAEQEKATVPVPKRSLFRKVIDLLLNNQRRRTFLFDLYQRWDRRNIVPTEDPHAVVDCSARLEHMASISVTPIGRRFVHRFPVDAVERIAKNSWMF